MRIKTKLILIGLLPWGMAVAFGLVFSQGHTQLGALRDRVGQTDEWLSRLEGFERAASFSTFGHRI
ncbi:hypothetical protein [Thiorhodococcus fuscus]|uniref:Uncharacterized protein n=1 Tax=Thiorhodococcus fuscus TaxID=527200 RepID=A0ABW4YD88_9GAMM